MTEYRNPLVSVVIPTYNRGWSLERALNSIVAQTYTNWEALIIDNHSNDNTDQIVEGINDPRFKLFKIHNEGVIAASRNVGIEKARGEIIAFLDSDDWWTPEKLEKSVEEMESGSDLVYHDLFIFYENGPNKKSNKTKTRELVYPIFDDLLQNGNGIVNSSVLVRKAFLEKSGGIPEDKDLVSLEDYMCWLAISQITNRFKRLSGCHGWYSIGGSNTSNAELRERNCRRFMEIYGNITGAKYPIWISCYLSRLFLIQRRFEGSKEHSLNVIAQIPSVKLFTKSVVTYFLACYRSKVSLEN